MKRGKGMKGDYSKCHTTNKLGKRQSGKQLEMQNITSFSELKGSFPASEAHFVK